MPHYQSPEARFEGRIDITSDVWALASTIFEICARFSPFEAFLGGDDEILKEIVATWEAARTIAVRICSMRTGTQGSGTSTGATTCGEDLDQAEVGEYW